MPLEGVEVDEEGRRVVRNKDGEIISRQAKSCDPTQIYCGTWSGIQVYTHVSTFVFMLVLTIAEASLSSEKGLMATYCIFYSLMLWVSIVLHELCVAFMARRYGETVEKVLVWPLGGFGNTGLTKDAGEDINIALAGPASHVPFVIMLIVIVYEQKSVHNLVLSSHTIDEKFSLYLALGLLAQQTLLFVANLLVPVYPFDAGRIFMNICTRRGVPIRKAVQASCILGLLWFLAGVGFFLYQLAVHNGGYSRGMFVLLFGWMLYQMGTKWLTRDGGDCAKLRLTEPYLMWHKRMEDQVKAANEMEAVAGDTNGGAAAPPPDVVLSPASPDAPAPFEESPAWAQGESTTEDEPLDLSNPFG